MRLPDLDTGPVTLRAADSGWRVERDGHPVGAVRLCHLEQGTGRLEVTVEPGSRDAGVGSAALRLAAGWLLSDGQLGRVEHHARFGAWAALRAAEKAGFGFEGLLRGGGTDGADVWLSARLATDDGAERALLLPQPWLHGGAVTLRPYEPGDAADVVAACNDPQVRRWITALPAPYTDADGRWWVERGAHEGRARGAEVNFAVVDNATGRLAGAVGLHHLDPRRRQAEIGYWMAPWGRGRGHAAEAARVASRWAFAALGVRRVNLYAAVGNGASQRVAEKAGFTRDGVVPAASVDRDGQPQDMVLFGRTA